MRVVLANGDGRHGDLVCDPPDLFPLWGELTPEMGPPLTVVSACLWGAEPHQHPVALATDFLWLTRYPRVT